MTAVSTDRRDLGSRLADLGRTLVSPRGAVFLLLIVLLVAITVLNPSFAEPSQFIRFIQRVAPIAIVAIGQYFVIVGGEFDLSMGSVVTAQVVIAGNLIGQDEAKSLPVLALMLAFGALIGLVNGLIVSFLKVPSFIVTLGMMLALLGGTLYWTGGAATGNPADGFREIGRGGIRGIPVIDILPWSVLVLAVVLAVAIWFSKRPFGRTIIALGDNPTTARFAGARSWWVKTSTFMISSLSATIAGVLLVGYAGVHPSVGRGYEFIAITAVVLGGVVLGGGRGWVVAAAAGAFALEALFTLLNFAGVPSTYRDAVQGAIIIIAVAYSATTFRARRRGKGIDPAPAASTTIPDASAEASDAASGGSPGTATQTSPDTATQTSPAPAEERDAEASARPASIPSTSRADNETKGGS
ncbi:ABC transporter permease [Agromyces sp. H3Y2-19a]|jgi:ribose transport system permease protein|uniref:ABC transporter permease n=1 Tax=Agromyces TaxID=33877 RepID=UPI001E573F26|nr:MULTISPECIES: ABC transporter permease [Agromyces]MCD5348285.1 ABC transporter permease [Agromyces sp. S2-1-8]MDF0514110.1 ABC transporter permease [Agromyces chromiiresistens]